MFFADSGVQDLCIGLGRVLCVFCEGLRKVCLGWLVKSIVREDALCWRSMLEVRLIALGWSSFSGVRLCEDAGVHSAGTV